MGHNSDIHYIAIATHQIQNVDVLVGQYAHDLLVSHGQKSSDGEALSKTTTRARVGRESERSQKGAPPTTSVLRMRTPLQHAADWQVAEQDISVSTHSKPPFPDSSEFLEVA